MYVYVYVLAGYIYAFSKEHIAFCCKEVWVPSINMIHTYIYIYKSAASNHQAPCVSDHIHTYIHTWNSHFPPWAWGKYNACVHTYIHEYPHSAQYTCGKCSAYIHTYMNIATPDCSYEHGIWRRQVHASDQGENTRPCRVPGAKKNIQSHMIHAHIRSTYTRHS
jgi:hypothetical protein